MAWSIRQLAELAGTTVEAVRHHHAVGLLGEPDRLADGDEQYGIPHLVRALQITRLVDLGAPLPHVASAGLVDQDSEEALRVLDADLVARIDRLQQVRAGLPTIPGDPAPVDPSLALTTATDDLSDVDRTMLTIYGRVLDGSWTDHLRPGLPDERRTEGDDVFEQLPPDADGATRQRIAEAVAAATQEHLRGHILVSDAEGRASGRPDVGSSTVLAALRELYNQAQVDVLQRAWALTQSEPDVRDER